MLNTPIQKAPDANIWHQYKTKRERERDRDRKNGPLIKCLFCISHFNNDSTYKIKFHWKSEPVPFFRSKYGNICATQPKTNVITWKPETSCRHVLILIDFNTIRVCSFVMKCSCIHQKVMCSWTKMNWKLN